MGGGAAGTNEISVIIPTFNSAQYIREAIESVQAQTLAASEIIVIDDGSTDGTAATVRSIGDPRVQYVFQQNGGVSRARNEGLARARGEFITFLDADDRWCRPMLERQVAVLAPDPSLVCSITNLVRFVDGTEARLSDQFSFCPEFDWIPSRPLAVPHAFRIEGDAFCALVQFGEHPTFTQSMAFRRSLIRDLQFDESMRICEDTAFSLRAFMHGGVAFNREPLVEVRRHASNATADHEMIAVDRVRALRSIAPFVADGARRNAFDARLVRAHVTAARVLARRGERRRSLAQFADATHVRGSYRRKVGGGLRLMFDLLRPANGVRS